MLDSHAAARELSRHISGQAAEAGVDRPDDAVLQRDDPLVPARQALEEALRDREPVDDVHVGEAFAPVRCRTVVTGSQASPAFHNGVFPSSFVMIGRLSRGIATMWPP